MSGDGAAAPDAGLPIDLERREMNVIKQHKAAVVLVSAFAIMIVIRVLTS